VEWIRIHGILVASAKSVCLVDDGSQVTENVGHVGRGYVLTCFVEEIAGSSQNVA